jgi:hypothetical protein
MVISFSIGVGKRNNGSKICAGHLTKGAHSAHPFEQQTCLDLADEVE